MLLEKRKSAVATWSWPIPVFRFESGPDVSGFLAISLFNLAKIQLSHPCLALSLLLFLGMSSHSTDVLSHGNQVYQCYLCGSARHGRKRRSSSGTRCPILAVCTHLSSTSWSCRGVENISQTSFRLCKQITDICLWKLRVEKHGNVISLCMQRRGRRVKLSMMYST